LRVKLILSQENGFINREEVPDYGVDLDIELIADDQNASAHKFAVQIKSAAKLQTVKKNGMDFYSFSFETSRLNYLCKRDLGFGILVLYDATTKTCYFDYVFDLVKRVEEFNPVKNWRAQKKVTVYIARTQVLDEESAQEIHKNVLGLYARHDLLLRDHGSRYDLPYFNPASDTAALPKPDLNNPVQIVELLKKFGGALFNQQQFPMLLDLFSKLTSGTINASPALTFLAAVTHGQVGDLVEGEYYLAKCKPHAGTMNAESQMLLDFTRVRLDFLRGNLDVEAYAERMDELASRSTSTLNGLVLRINTLYLTLVANTNWSKEHDLADRIADIFAQINASALEEPAKMLLILYNSESLQILGSSISLQEAILAKAWEAGEAVVFTGENLTRLRTNAARVKQARQYAYAAYQYAVQHVDSNLQASAAQYLARYFLSMEFNSMILQAVDNTPLTPQVEQVYKSTLKLADDAYQIFSELSLWKDAHQTLSSIAELQHIFFLRYGKDIGPSPQTEVLTRIQQLAEKLGLPAFKSVVTATHQQVLETLNVQSPWQNIGVAGSFEDYARKILSIYNLPEERLVHIVADLRSQAAFRAGYSDDRIHLLSSVSLRDNPGAAYTEPVSYILRDRITGQVTEASTDMEILLAQIQLFPKTP